MKEEPIKLLNILYGDGWLYALYSNGTVARKLMNSKYDWEAVELPVIKEKEVEVPEPKEPSTVPGGAKIEPREAIKERL